MASDGRTPDAASSSVLLKAHGLTKHFGAVTAVRGVDFDLPRNGFVTILGPSGCGKTTILRMIGGFESVSEGSLEMDGHSLLGQLPNRRPINTVFQNYALFPHLSVFDNVAFGLKLKRLAPEEISRRVGDALGKVGMGSMLDRFPNQLSGGQQQRVALARAFINEPRLLLLDEPLGALDLKMRRHMQVELKNLQRRLGMTFLYVTHDQEEAFALSDWLIVMDHGRIEQQDTPEGIYYRPDNVFVADFIGGANLISGRMTALQDGRAALHTALGRITGSAAPSLADGEPASACIRMEKVRVGAGGEGLTAAGVIRHVIFQGNSRIIEVVVDTHVLRARVDDNLRITVGEPVELGLPEEHVRIVRGRHLPSDETVPA